MISDAYKVNKHIYKNPEKFEVDKEQDLHIRSVWWGFVTSGLNGMLAQRNESTMVKLTIMECLCYLLIGLLMSWRKCN